MDPMTIGAIAGAGLGLLKGENEKRREQEAMRLKALENVYAPIFGKAPDLSMQKKADTFQSMLDFGVKGAAVGHAMGKGAEGAVPAGDAKASAAVTGDKSSMMSGTGVNQLSFAPEAGTNYGAMTNQTLSDVNPNMSLMPDTGVNRLSFMDNQPMSQNFGVQQLPNQFDTLQQDLYQQPYFGATQAPQSQAPRFGINQIRMYR